MFSIQPVHHSLQPPSILQRHSKCAAISLQDPQPTATMTAATEKPTTCCGKDGAQCVCGMSFSFPRPHQCKHVCLCLGFHLREKSTWPQHRIIPPTAVTCRENRPQSPQIKHATMWLLRPVGYFLTQFLSLKPSKPPARAGRPRPSTALAREPRPRTPSRDHAARAVLVLPDSVPAIGHRRRIPSLPAVRASVVLGLLVCHPSSLYRI